MPRFGLVATFCAGDRLSSVDAGVGADREIWFGYVAMVVGSFLAILDIQIVASSINEIRAGLSASVDEIQWVQTSYLIAEVIAIPASGYLSRMLSARVYYAISAVGFTLASAACAFAWNLGSMILFRAVQGLFGGGMIPTAFATMFILFPDERRRALPQVLSGMVTMTASSLGPTIGGYVTELLSWQWLFLLNLVPGLICAAVVWRTIQIDRPQPELWRVLDLRGLLFMAMFLGGFEYALDEGPRRDWFDDDAVAACTIMAVIAGGLFIWRSFTVKHPIVELRLLANRNFALTSLVSTLMGMTMFTLVYLTPMFLSQVRGYSPLDIGRIMMVQGFSMFFTAPIVGRLQTQMDRRLLIAIGALLVGAGCWLNGHLTDQWGFAEFFLPQALRGAGFITAFIPMTNLALGTLSDDDVKNGSGLYNVTRNIGGAMGLAIVTTLINQRSWTHWQALAGNVRLSREPVRETLVHTTAMLEPGLHQAAHQGAIASLARQAQMQALTMTYGDIYLILSAAISVGLLLVPWLQQGSALERVEVEAA